ncbi:23S rRNA (adenine(2030)-N(6))-methyltransferase RlmJ [Thalassoglobus sp. JC818]|uniref:23S rRNA (adenine(2030)-N(6))-methyltransferase RlmJ n=1 Tax=Thalassoglobus sp. JC818 TaxID=3232136 RepID=UPI00345AA53E
MEQTVIVEWTFTPDDFFEEPFTIEFDRCKLEIESSKVSTNIQPSEFTEALKHSLHRNLHDHFRGVMLASHKEFELSQPLVSRLHDDGHRVVELSGTCVIKSGGSVDCIVTNGDGVVIRDTRAERIAKKQKTATRIAGSIQSDVLVPVLVASYEAAVRDPDNELIHLYEIREALKKQFNNEGNLRTKLGITKSDWSDFGRLANDEPVKQGRHRGSHLGNLRGANEEELTSARNFSFSLIEAYLNYLDRQEAEHHGDRLSQPEVRYDHSKKIGNQGDVIKHACWVSLLVYALNQNPDGIVADIHAGRREYELPQTGEWKNGIGKLAELIHEHSPLSSVLESYAGKFIAKDLAAGSRYFGSCGISQELIRNAGTNAQLWLCDTNEEVTKALIESFAGSSNVSVRNTDGYSLCMELDTNVTAVLIDPPSIETEQTVAAIEHLNKYQIQFLCWMPRTSKYDRKEKRATEAGTSLDFITRCRGVATVHTVQWYKFGHRTPGCTLAVSKHHPDTIKPVLSELCNILGWSLNGSTYENGTKS